MELDTQSEVDFDLDESMTIETCSKLKIKDLKLDDLLRGVSESYISALYQLNTLLHLTDRDCMELRESGSRRKIDALYRADVRVKAAIQKLYVRSLVEWNST